MNEDLGLEHLVAAPRYDGCVPYRCPSPAIWTPQGRVSFALFYVV